MVNNSRPSKFYQYAVTNIPIQPKMPTCYSFCFTCCRMRARCYCIDWFTSHLVFRCPSNCLHLVTCQGIFWSYWQIRAYSIAVILLCIQFERFRLSGITAVSKKPDPGRCRLVCTLVGRLVCRLVSRLVCTLQPGDTVMFIPGIFRCFWQK